MGKRINIRADVSVKELEDATGKHRTGGAQPVAYRLAAGTGAAERLVAEVSGYSLTWVYTVARRYTRTATGDRGWAPWQSGRSAPPERGAQAELDQALEGARPTVAGGRRRGGGLDRRAPGRRVGIPTGGRYLRRLDWRRHRPRPRHAKARPQAEAAFKHALSERWQRCGRRIPPRTSRYGRPMPSGGPQPIVGRVWARKGSGRSCACAPLPVALRARLCPSGLRLSAWQFASTVNTAVMNVALVLRRHGGRWPDQALVLVLDQPGTTPARCRPQGLHLVFRRLTCPSSTRSAPLAYTDQPLLNEPSPHRCSKTPSRTTVIASTPARRPRATLFPGGPLFDAESILWEVHDPLSCWERQAEGIDERAERGETSLDRLHMRQRSRGGARARAGSAYAGLQQQPERC